MALVCARFGRALMLWAMLLAIGCTASDRRDASADNATGGVSGVGGSGSSHSDFDIDAAPNLLDFDPSAMQPFDAVYQHLDRESGELPNGWSANCWDPDAGCRVFLTEKEGRAAVALENTSGRGSVQMYQWEVMWPDVTPGDYVFVAEYYLEEGAHGTVSIRGPGMTERELSLQSEFGVWLEASYEWTQSSYGQFDVSLHNDADQNTIYFGLLKLARK